MAAPAAAAAPPGTNVRQYNIVTGGLGGAATGMVQMDDMRTNLDYYANSTLPYALIFSKGDFTSKHYVTGENIKSLYAVLLAPLQYYSHEPGLAEAVVRAACVAAPVMPPGTLVPLYWDNTISLLTVSVNAQNVRRLLTIRPELCVDAAPDSPPPQDNHGGLIIPSERRRFDLKVLLEALHKAQFR